MGEYLHGNIRFGQDRAADRPVLTHWPAAQAYLEAASQGERDPRRLLDVLGAATTPPPVPGQGSTGDLWELLATVASHDLLAVRVLEPHLDAAAILHQAGHHWPQGSTWGVFAAESPGPRLTATAQPDGSWLLSGPKSWCSLAGELDRALVSAQVGDTRRLFAVDLAHPGVGVEPGEWHSAGLAELRTATVCFTEVPAKPVGQAGWYLQRPGFAVGAVGVAACWFGGAVGLYRTLHRHTTRRDPDQLALAWLGEADRLVHSAAVLLDDAARLADAGALSWTTALRVRGQVAELCQRLLALVGEATGPGPLVADRAHALRVADLHVYLRQHHGARDDAALGRELLEPPAAGQAP